MDEVGTDVRLMQFKNLFRTALPNDPVPPVISKVLFLNILHNIICKVINFIINFLLT